MVRFTLSSLIYIKRTAAVYFQKHIHYSYVNNFLFFRLELMSMIHTNIAFETVITDRDLDETLVSYDIIDAVETSADQTPAVTVVEMDGYACILSIFCMN